jgi:two-component system, OmpR family, sensor kinase
MSRTTRGRADGISEQMSASTSAADASVAQVLPAALTLRQREVAVLVARGFTNEEIAHQLILTTGTVANHVATILNRLGLLGRSQIAAWATAHGLNGTQDRQLVTLERLLEVEPADLPTAMDQVATLLAEVLGTDKVDAFIHEGKTDTLVAVGASDTPMGRHQQAIGLDRQPVANGGRSVEIFQSGQPHLSGRVDQDPDELIGVKGTLGVRSQIGVPLDIAGIRRGALLAQSAQPNFFSDRDLRFLQAVSRWVGNVAHRAELAEHSAAAARAQGRRLAAEELVTVLAHDLRNFLTPIRARLDMLSRRAAREEHRANLKDVQSLHGSVGRLERLILDLLDVARIDQGLFRLSPQPFDLVVLAHELSDVLGAPQSPIVVQGPAELGITGDSMRLRQALENLISNAQQHSPEGAPVTLTLSSEDRDDVAWAVIEVSDDGPGIAPEVLPQLFERFARGAGSEGLGLGLHLAHQIATAHGGALDAASPPTGGSIFRLSLPVDGPVVLRRRASPRLHSSASLSATGKVTTYDHGTRRDGATS